MTAYYVDNVNGNDGNAGTSEGAAKATISAGVGLLASAGDILYIQSAGSNYTLTSAQAITLAGSTSGKYRIEGYTTTPGAQDGRPTITCATNSVNLFELNAATYVDFVHLKITHTAGTRGAAFAGVTAASSDIRIIDCVVDGCSYAVSASSRELNVLTFAGNTVINCTSGGIANAANIQYLLGNTFRSNTGSGWDSAGATVSTGVFIGNLFASNGRGIYDTGTTRTMSFIVVGNTFANNTDDGFRSDETTGSIALLHANNIYWSNGGSGDYGINLQDGATEIAARLLFNRNNAYGDNGTGSDHRNNLSAGTGDVTLTADPFTNAAGGDYSLNNTAGGGAACRAVAFPASFVDGSTTNALDIGAVQHEDAGGGGTVPMPVSMSGGLLV